MGKNRLRKLEMLKILVKENPASMGDISDLAFRDNPPGMVSRFIHRLYFYLTDGVGEVDTYNEFLFQNQQLVLEHPRVRPEVVRYIDNLNRLRAA